MDGISAPPPVISTQPQLQQQNQFEAQALISKIQANLPLGTTIMAQVLGGDKNGNIIVRANGSDLVLSSPLALAKGAQIQIRLDSVSGSIHAELLSIDGKLPPSQPQALENFPQKNPQDHPLLKLVQVTPQNAAKIALQPHETAIAAANKLDSVMLSSGQNFALKGIILQPTPEVAQNIRAILALSENSRQKLATNLPEEIKAGTNAEVKITAVTAQPKMPVYQEVDTSNSTLKGQDWMKDFLPKMSATPEGNIKINALVVGAKPDGEMLVETKIGLMQIDGKTAPFLKGTEIELEISNLAKPQNNLHSQIPQEEMAHEWQNLKETTSNNKELANKLAGSEQNFAAKLASFAEAVKTGNVEKWLGQEFLQGLDEDAKSLILNKLGADLANLRNISTESAQNGWQSLLFPVFDGQELHQAKLHIRNFKNPSKADAEAAGTRFIVELETSYYGQMQFDGLVKKNQANRSFDLIIRTTKNLDAETNAGIRDIFVTTQQLTGFKGNMEFAFNPHFPTEPWRDFISKKMKHDSVMS